MDIIPTFFKKWYNHEDGEKLYIIDNKGKSYENYNRGKEVEIPIDAKEEGETNGILLSIHNHTNGCSFQSIEDYDIMAKLTEKYKITVSLDGITISKNINTNEKILYNDIKKSYNNYWLGLSSNIEQNKNKNGLKEILTQFKNKSINEKELDEKTTQVFLNHLNKNSDIETKKLSNQFKKDKIPVQVSHIKIKKVYD